MKSFATVITPIVLPWPVRIGLETATRALFDLGRQFSVDFLRPAGEAALVSLFIWRCAGSIEPTQREGLAVQRTTRANTARFRGFHLKADRYRRPQRGPVTDVNLPRGLRGRRVS
jgi:hypothetical protein